jgi:hypothetical protein
VSEVTRILDAARHGEPSAADELLPLVYHELRRLAAHKMAQEAPGPATISNLMPRNASSAEVLTSAALPCTSNFAMNESPNDALLTPVGVVSSANAGHAVDPAWLSFIVTRQEEDK